MQKKFIIIYSVGNQNQLCHGGGMVYTEDLKSSAERLKGSSPFRGTKDYF